MLGVLIVSQMLSSFSPIGGQSFPFLNTLPTIRGEAPKAQAEPRPENQCGRTQAVYLPPIAATRLMPDYPQNAIRHGEEGATQIVLVVDKDGEPTGIKINKSSGFADLDEAAAAAVARYRWTKPRYDCADQGVAQAIIMNWDMGVPGIAIAAGSADYPAIAKAQNLSAMGAVVITQTGDTVTDVKLEASTGSPELDKAMLDFAHAQIQLPSLVRDDKSLTASMAFTIRFTADPARPVKQLPVNLPVDIVTVGDVSPPLTAAK